MTLPPFGPQARINLVVAPLPDGLRERERRRQIARPNIQNFEARLHDRRLAVTKIAPQPGPPVPYRNLVVELKIGQTLGQTHHHAKAIAPSRQGVENADPEVAPHFSDRRVKEVAHIDAGIQPRSFPHLGEQNGLVPRHARADGGPNRADARLGAKDLNPSLEIKGIQGSTRGTSQALAQVCRRVATVPRDHHFRQLPFHDSHPENPAHEILIGQGGPAVRVARIHVGPGQRVLKGLQVLAP